MKALKILGGIVLIALGIWGIVAWRWDVLTIIKGCIGIIAVLVGVIFFFAAKE